MSNHTKTPLSYGRQMIYDYIKDNGPISAKEIYTELALDRKWVHATIHALRVSTKLGDMRVIIKDWISDEEKGRRWLRRRFVIAHKRNKDAPKPPALNYTERSRRYRNKKRVKVNSVFALGALHGSSRHA